MPCAVEAEFHDLIQNMAKYVYLKRLFLLYIFSHQNHLQLRALTVLPSSETEECCDVVGSDLFSVTPPPEDQITVRVSLFYDWVCAIFMFIFVLSSSLYL